MLASWRLTRSFTDWIKVIYYTLQKPWQQFNVSGASQIWWNKFYGAHPADNTSWRRRLHALQDRTFDLVVGMLGG